MPDLTYRRVSPDGYRVSFDGVEIGSIFAAAAPRSPHQDVLALGYRHDAADRRPDADGDTDTFQAALVAFKEAFTRWLAGVPPEKWQENLEHTRLRARSAGANELGTSEVYFRTGTVIAFRAEMTVKKSGGDHARLTIIAVTAIAFSFSLVAASGQGNTWVVNKQEIQRGPVSVKDNPNPPCSDGGRPEMLPRSNT